MLLGLVWWISAEWPAVPGNVVTTTIVNSDLHRVTDSRSRLLRTVPVAQTVICLSVVRRLGVNLTTVHGCRRD